MAKSKEKSLLDTKAMENLRSSNCAQFASFIEGVAAEAKKMNAGTASATFSYVGEEDSVDGEFVPFITFGVKRPE